MTLPKFTSNELSLPCGGTALGRYLRVALDSSGETVVHDATAGAVGFLTDRGADANKANTVISANAPSWVGIASAAIALGAKVEAAAAGQVATFSAGVIVGVAGEAAAAAGDEIMILASDD